MKIRDIDTILIDSPGRKWTIVRVFTDEDIVGLGEATYSQKEPVVVAAVEHLKQELIGEDPSRIEYLWHKLYLRSSLSGIWRMAGPVWMSAMSGIDQALWDIKGKVANLPVVELLGGKFRDRVEVYTHFGGATPEDSAQMAREKVEEGYTALKGGARSRSGADFGQYADDGNPVETAEHFAAVREAVGPDVKLLIDCHGRFTVAQCIRLARAIEPSELYVFEDPVPPDDLNAYPKVRREISIPVMGSERLNHQEPLPPIVGYRRHRRGSARPDVRWRITEVRKIAAIADTFHVPISPHNTKGPVGIIAAAHLMASIPNVAPMEFVTGIAWRDENHHRAAAGGGQLHCAAGGPGFWN